MLIVVASVISVIWIKFDSGLVKLDSADTLPELRGKLIRSVAHIGAEKTYKLLVTTYATSTRAHSAAHVMGEILSQSFGAAGVHVCDGAFSYGCHHGLVQGLFKNGGFEQVKQLAYTCTQISENLRATCAHGFGHGALASGDKGDLQRGILICEDIFSPNLASACANGVFMHYNRPFDSREEGDSQGSLRPLDMTRPFSPCDNKEIPDTFLGACYSSLPSFWWDQVGGVDEVIRLCKRAPTRFLKNCYQGMGVQIPGVVGYDAAKAVRICEKISMSAGSKSCLEQVARTLEEFGHDACAVYAALRSEKNNCKSPF
ncbi:MAG: hypothetical protein RIQ56_567 [Candidatus Parcubacteria bacterium]